jgi:hypothetical protein
MESLVDVYPYTGANNYIQFCTRERVAVGGGSPTSEPDSPEVDVQASHKHHEWGFGISLSPDLLTGTSSPCLTFASPSLSTAHKDGSVFEVINVELWTVRHLTKDEKVSWRKAVLLTRALAVYFSVNTLRDRGGSRETGAEQTVPRGQLKSQTILVKPHRTRV